MRDSGPRDSRPYGERFRAFLMALLFLFSMLEIEMLCVEVFIV